MPAMMIIWIVLGAAAIVLFAVLIARQFRSGDREAGMPTSVSGRTHDSPSAGSDAEIAERKRENGRSAEERTRELVDIDRTLGHP